MKSIEKEYSAKLRQTRRNKLVMALRQGGRQKMLSAAKSAGLRIPRYNRVMMLVQRGAALRKRVLGH